MSLILLVSIKFVACDCNATGDKPKLKELQRLCNGCMKVTVLKSVAPKWKELAMEMGFEYNDIETVDLQVNKDPQEAAYRILGMWLRGSSGLSEPVTWGTLIECVSNVECQSLADKLSDVLL